MTPEDHGMPLVTPAGRREARKNSKLYAVHPTAARMGRQGLAGAGSNYSAGETKSPGALAGATGANNKAVSFTGEHSPAPLAVATPCSDPDRFMDNVTRTVSAHAVIDAVFACHPDDRRWLVELILDDLPPHDPSFAPDHQAMAWARGWAEIASRNERKAWALACYEAMPGTDRTAFLDHINGRAAA